MLQPVLVHTFQYTFFAGCFLREAVSTARWRTCIMPAPQNQLFWPHSRLWCATF